MEGLIGRLDRLDRSHSATLLATLLATTAELANQHVSDDPTQDLLDAHGLASSFRPGS
jgi:hypothetical protein